MFCKSLGSIVAAIVMLISIDGRAATFRRLGSIAGGPFYVSPDGATAANLSADGNVITGQTSYNPFNGGQVGFRWTWDGGMKWLGKPDGFFGTTYDFTAFPQDISTDGSVVVGQVWARMDPTKQAFRWTAAGGMTAFPSYLSFDVVSPDGEMMVSELTVFDSTGNEIGTLPSNLNDGSPFFEASAYVAKIIEADGPDYFYGRIDRYNPAAGNVGEQFLCRWRLGESPEMLPNSTLPRGVGMTVGDVTAGGGMVLVNDYNNYVWRLWTADKGFHQIPGLVGPTTAGGMSADGKVIVFNMSNTSQIWDEQHGTRPLQQLLAQEYELGDEMAGWNLYSVHDLSDDGTVISGEGINPEGHREYWVVNLRPIPEQNAATLCAVSAIALAVSRRRGRPANVCLAR